MFLSIHKNTLPIFIISYKYVLFVQYALETKGNIIPNIPVVITCT